MLARSLGRTRLAAAAALVALVSGALAAQAPPAYRLTYLGPGSPVALNDLGTVAGAQVVNNNYVPLVSEAGGPWRVLPVPAGAVSVFPTDLNDHDEIVGVAYDAGWNPVAVRWRRVAGAFQVEVLPRLPGDGSSYATGLNNRGEIVGARRALGYVPAATTGWLYSDTAGVVDLYAAYGWATVPSDLDDQGRLISGTVRWDLATGGEELIGTTGPSNYQAIGAAAISAAGRIAGQAALSSTSLNIVSVFRFEEPGWRFLAGTSKYTAASSINDLGDVGYGELGAGLYLDGLGAFAVGSLLAAAELDAGWAITGSRVEVNNLRMLATLGRNSVTGESGGVLLTPEGTLPPPSAPANLVGTPMPATVSHPYPAIDLVWENTSALTRGWELERRASPAGAWSRLSLIPPGTAAHHEDATVAPDVLYDYRVRATGLGGASGWSNVATVRAPRAPADTTPPMVTIVTPANGASVGGVVRVRATAADDTGVVRMTLALAKGAELASANGAELVYDWNTRRFKRGSTQTLVVRAWDANGNVGSATVTVRIAR